MKIKTALLSVSDKTNIVEFAAALEVMGVTILSTGGTATLLRDRGIRVKDVADYTGFPEMMDGRLKTLHPKIHGGLLARRDINEHMASAKKHGIDMIDLVVVNLYPFAQTIAKKGVTLPEAVEQIDIGGPTMLRSAAKNHQAVGVVCNPNRYNDVIDELKNNKGALTDKTRLNLAQEVFAHTGTYDQMIASYLAQHTNLSKKDTFSDEIAFRATKSQVLRYGENPHQQAMFYANASEKYGLGNLQQLHGKELSFNNILDLNAALQVVKDFTAPAAVIIKHNNPTGVAQAKTIDQAFNHALACDPLSAFGGIIGLNKAVDVKTAQAISDSGFMECVIAPKFQAAALKILMAKKNLRLVQVDFKELNKDTIDVKHVYGGLLVQERDSKMIKKSDLKVVTKKKPTIAQVEAMLFGWKAVKHVRSNAVILVKGQQTVGMGVGQTSRVDSALNAIRKAGDRAVGSILISDAFLPMPDTVTIVAKAGIKAIIQTGGSIKDPDVIAEANKYNIAMVTTGVRHFKH